MIKDDNFDILKTWLSVNYAFVLAAMQPTEQDRVNIFKLDQICRNHGVSFKTFMDIMTEYNGVMKQ